MNNIKVESKITHSKLYKNFKCKKTVSNIKNYYLLSSAKTFFYQSVIILQKFEVILLVEHFIITLFN